MKKTISILLTLCMIVALMPAAMAAKKATFKDVPENMWCFDSVEYVADKGYFKGTTDTTFEPNGPMTRQQFVVVLSRLAKVTVNNNQSPFSDVPAGSYSAGAIAWAAKNGITEGYGDGSFHPTEPITRQQMAAFMNRFMVYYAKNNSVRFVVQGKKINFKDAADIAAYAKDAVPYCVKFGMIQGYEDGTFRPNATATRAHVAAIIERLDRITSKNAGGGSYFPSATYCTVTFQGATVNGQSSASVVVGSTYTVPTPDAKPGYTFVKWNDGTRDYAAGNTFTVNGNVTLTAVWEEQIVPNDLLKTAFINVVKYINDEVYSRYENAQGVVEIDSITLDPVTTNFSNDTREIYVNGSAELMDDTIQSLVRRAINYATALVESADPAADVEADYATIKATVIEVVEALGLQWTGADIEAMARQIYTQGADAAADIWDMFQANGGYIFETADVIVSGNTVFSINAASKSTSLGAKASAKALAVAIAKELYADLKTETTPDNVVELTSAVTMKFNNVPAVAQNYPTEYTMVATMTFTSDVFGYYYANDAHHFVLTISQDWQDAYDEALANVAAEALNLVEETLSEKLDELLGGFLGGASMDALVEKLVRFGMYDSVAEANAAIEAVAESAAAAWMEVNLSTAATPDGVNYYLPYDFFWTNNGQIEIVGDQYILSLNGVATGRGLFNNEVMIQPIEAWADQLIANADIQGIIDDTMSDVLDDETKAEYQDLVVSEAVAQLNGGSASSFVTYLTNGTLNGTGRNLFKDMFLFDDVAALSAAPAAAAIAGFDNALSYDCEPRTAEHMVKNVLLLIVTDKVDAVFADVMAGMTDPMVTDLINSSANVQSYVKYKAMIEMGFANTYRADLDAISAAAETDIRAFLNDYVEDMINDEINPAEIADMVDAQIVSLLTPYTEYLQLLPYLQMANTFDELASVECTVLADALASNELQALIDEANISDANMTKALNGLAKVIEKLPADACVVINGVEFCEAELADVKAAAESGDIADVCDEIAALIYALGSISLNNFNVPVQVTYGTHSVDAVLHIVIA